MSSIQYNVLNHLNMSALKSSKLRGLAQIRLNDVYLVWHVQSRVRKHFDNKVTSKKNYSKYRGITIIHFLTCLSFLRYHLGNFCVFRVFLEFPWDFLKSVYSSYKLKLLHSKFWKQIHMEHKKQMNTTF